jgi:quinol monooxygenase YgiN
MITRIVKMNFREEMVDAFLSIFDSAEAKIKNFKGCRSLELFHDKHDRSTIFTISTWDSEEDLLAYRSSEVFNDVWPRTKAMFKSEAEAWTLERRGR